VTVQASVLAITPDDILLLEPSEQDAFVAMLDKIADARGEGGQMKYREFLAQIALAQLRNGKNGIRLVGDVHRRDDG
jgi:hypothetical protein